MKNKKGFSLIELLLTLAILAALSLTAFVLYKKIEYNSKIKNEYQNVIQIHQVYDKYYKPEYLTFSNT